jgi:queuosine precursor transporter
MIHLEPRSEKKTYQYFDLIMAAFVTLLLCSNLIGAAKVCHVAGVTFGGTLLFFPITYLFGDILTEVYGYKRSRKVVWTGFIALIFSSLVAWFILALPPAEGWNHQTEFSVVFTQTPRLVAASLAAYFVGELTNSYVLAKMKILTQGKWLWTRIVGSTILGEAIDTLIFYPLAFYGVWNNSLLIQVLLTSYTFKVIWEILMTPFTYKIVNFLKRVENEDYFDLETNFSPFSLKE